MNNQKPLVKATLIMLVFIVAATLFFSKPVHHLRASTMDANDAMPATITVDTSSQPVLGKEEAPVTVVAFESLECSHCKRYMETIFPEFKKQYIDTGKVKYTPILISFSHYDVAGQGAYCAFQQSPSAYFAFLDQAYLNQPQSPFWTINGLLDVAKTVPKLDLTQMEKNIAMLDEYKIKGVPMILVNGIPVESLSQESLFQMINDQLAQSH
jgi:protein-disulfide isomerase